MSAPTNEELFASAVASLKSAEPAWHGQLAMAFGNRPVELHIDWDSLGGRFDNVQPFVHRVIAGVLDAMATVAFTEPKADLSFVRRVEIAGTYDYGERGEGSESLTFDDGTLRLQVSFQPADVVPAASIASLIRSTLGRQASPPPPAPPLPPRENPLYATAALFILDLEAALKAHGLWPPGPPPVPFEVRGAFGCENMPFEHWLAWLLIPRIREIIQTRGQFPQHSQIGAFAVKNLDGTPGGERILALLSHFDAAVEAHSEAC